MRTEICFGSRFEIIIHTEAERFTFDFGSGTLGQAILWAELVLENHHELLRASAIKDIYICDATTGEICAECYPDEKETGFDNPNYDPDWGFNEDEGFDPYLGLYTDDC